MLYFRQKPINGIFKEASMKRNIRIVLLGELVILLAVFTVLILLCNDPSGVIAYFFDLPSFLLLTVVLITGLLLTGMWKDFFKAFSVGIRRFSLLEIKNIIQAVEAAQKLTAFGVLFVILTEGILVMGNLRDLEALGPNLGLIALSALYAVIIEFFLFPLKLNAQHKMNEEMDLGDD